MFKVVCDVVIQFDWFRLRWLLLRLTVASHNRSSDCVDLVQIPQNLTLIWFVFVASELIDTWIKYHLVWIPQTAMVQFVIWLGQCDWFNCDLYQLSIWNWFDLWLLKHCNYEIHRISNYLRLVESLFRLSKLDRSALFGWLTKVRARREGEGKGNIVNSGDKAKLISLLGRHDTSERDKLEIKEMRWSMIKLSWFHFLDSVMQVKYKLEIKEMRWSISKSKSSS